MKTENLLDNPKTKEILALLAAGTLLTVSILAPGAPMALAAIFKPWQKYNKRKLRRVVKRLGEQELISFREEGNQTVVTLTEKGKKKILKYNIDKLDLKNNGKWDGKWRIIIFDIPNKKKNAREIFREKLKELGFYKLQKSVFISPYKCKDEISFLRAALEIKDHVKYLECQKIEEEEFLKDLFGL